MKPVSKRMPIESKLGNTAVMPKTIPLLVLVKGIKAPSLLSASLPTLKPLFTENALFFAYMLQDTTFKKRREIHNSSSVRI